VNSHAPRELRHDAIRPPHAASERGARAGQCRGLAATRLGSRRSAGRRRSWKPARGTHTRTRTCMRPRRPGRPQRGHERSRGPSTSRRVTAPAAKGAPLRRRSSPPAERASGRGSRASASGACATRACAPARHVSRLLSEALRKSRLYLKDPEDTKMFRCGGRFSCRSPRPPHPGRRALSAARV